MTDNGQPPPKPTKRNRKDYRHRVCGKLLFRAYLPPGTHLEIRCRCGLMHVVDIPLPPPEPKKKVDAEKIT